MKKVPRIALTGFMGVGKSSVARHLSQKLKIQRVDLDLVIEKNERRKVVEIVEADGIEHFRSLENKYLRQVLSDSDFQILSLGGGTWTELDNRELIISAGITTIWLESTFEHCWRNISQSRKVRPLARDKKTALRLFEERQKFYCLADLHMIVRPDFTSEDVAKKIVEEVFS